ncbi:MAG: hypothetical protein K5762_05725 [Bacilli bacterium]|nr:hypothetical protein [Bacilli bacterium]
MLKKFSIGTWITACAFVLTFLSFIFYFIGVNIEGYFQGETVTGTLLLTIFSLLGACGVVVYTLFYKSEGMVGKILDIVVNVLKAGIAIMLVFAGMILLNARVEGLAYIYASNEEILETIQTPANMASASMAIVTVVFLVLAGVAMIVSSFFSLRKTETVAVAE